MAKNFPKLTFTDFSGGLSTESSIFAQLDNPLDKKYGFKIAQSVLNVEMSENGLEKFAGYTNYLAAAISGTPIVTGIYEYERTGTGGSVYTIVTGGTKVYTANGGSLTEIYSGITAGARMQFVTFDNYCIMTNGVDVPLQYDGTTCQAITFDDPDSIFKNTGLTTATPLFAAEFRGRLFYGGDPTLPDRLWTPRPGTHNNFDNSLSTVDAFDIEGDGKLIGMLAVTKDMAAVYKTKSISRLAGSTPFGSTTDPFAIESVSKRIGCLAAKSIVEVGRDHMFLSQMGPKKLSLVFDYGDVDQLDPMADCKDEINDINFTASVIANAFAVFIESERQVWFHIPTGSDSQNENIYVYDVLTGAITLREGIVASCGAVVNRIYYTGTYSGQILQQLSGNSYNGTAIESRWESKWIAIGGLDVKKIFRSLLIYFETSGTATITVQWQIMKMDGSVQSGAKSSESAGGNVYDVGEYDEAVFDVGGETIFKKNNLGRGRALKLIITNNNLNEQWKVNRIELSYQSLGAVGR